MILFVLFKVNKCFLKKINMMLFIVYLQKLDLISMLAGYLSNIPTRVHTFTGQVWSTKKEYLDLF